MCFAALKKVNKNKKSNFDLFSDDQENTNISGLIFIFFK